MSMSSDSSRFALTTTFEGRDAVLTLRGSVENLAAFELGASLDATIDRDPTSVVLDLSGLTFIGAAGIVAVANAEKRLAEAGIHLTVRSPSALVDRLLGLMEMAETIRLEPALPRHAHLGPEDRSTSPSLARQLGSSVATKDLRTVTALPTDPDVIDGVLRLVVELTRSGIQGADGVSVSLRRHGRLSTVAASDETILAMDAHQYDTGEGPCIDASVLDHWFHAESLATETRWPAFTPRARDLGIKAILSSPLMAFDEPVGALNIYSLTASSFDVEAQEAAAVFAQKASAILSDAGADVSDTRMATRFKEALRSREVISMAQGVLMERQGLGEDDAFTALLRLSMHHGTGLRGRAEEVLLSARKPEFEIDAESHE
jgi:anti-anti-sigma factor